MTTPLQSVRYTAEATASNFGRDGCVRIAESDIALDLAKPPGMGGRTNDAGANPEQLFAAGYAACFHGALLFHARAEGIDVEGSHVTARVSIGPIDGGGLGLAVELWVRLPGLDEAVATKLTDTAHEACPYSRATRGNIEVAVTIDS